jgi:hypothetical protein
MITGKFVVLKYPSSRDHPFLVDRAFIPDNSASLIDTGDMQYSTHRVITVDPRARLDQLTFTFYWTVHGAGSRIVTVLAHIL